MTIIPFLKNTFIIIRMCHHWGVHFICFHSPWLDHQLHLMLWEMKAGMEIKQDEGILISSGQFSLWQCRMTHRNRPYNGVRWNGHGDLVVRKTVRLWCSPTYSRLSQGGVSFISQNWEWACVYTRVLVCVKVRERAIPTDISSSDQKVQNSPKHLLPHNNFLFHPRSSFFCSTCPTDTICYLSLSITLICS